MIETNPRECYPLFSELQAGVLGMIIPRHGDRCIKNRAKMVDFLYKSNNYL